jgi:hypothetical protein
VCMRPGTPDDMVQAVSSLLLSLNGRSPQGRAVLLPLQFNGFAPVDDKLFDTVRAIRPELLESVP